MCGLIGSTEFENDAFTQALTLLKHRGPDGAGHFSNEDIQLGHRRLSIIDLTENGIQPMSSQDKSAVIIFNGEIYNYQTLREELCSKGVIFRTHTDTEVILEGYRQEGAIFFKKLRGMWSLAIYDRRLRKVILSRDIFGIKPLYYTTQKGHLYFASEMKALRKYNLDFEPNTEGYHAYFSLGYFLAPETCYKNVFLLPPNTTLSYDLESKLIELHTIDSLIIQKETLNNETDVLSGLESALTESIKAHYVADVPVGLLFSGGVDSSLIAALSQRLGMNPTAYHLAIEGSADTEFAHSIAKKLNLNLEIVHMQESELVAQYEKIWNVLDVPFADASVIPTSLIFEKIRGKSKVVLGGEGGDEWFGGYDRHKSLASHRSFKNSNMSISIFDSLESGSPLGIRYFNPLLHKLRNYILQRQDDVIGTYLAHVSMMDYPLRKNALREKLFNIRRVYGEEEVHAPGLFYDRHMYLSNDLLFKTDIASMASSVEARVPFVDIELYKYLQGIVPGNLCISVQREPKYLLKKILERYIPRELIYRKKSGFGFSFKRYHIPQFKEDVLGAFKFHRKELETFGLTEVSSLLDDRNVDVIVEKYPRFAFAMVCNWKVYGK